jgi:predicted TIM-barrel fold metal-dependent hydrolase
MEVPWIDRPPTEIFRDHFRLTLQPFDMPDSADLIARLVDHLQSDELLLFSSDYPHWQFDGDNVWPAGLSQSLRQKVMAENPRAVYSRLKEAVQ